MRKLIFSIVASIVFVLVFSSHSLSQGVDYRGSKIIMLGMAEEETPKKLTLDFPVFNGMETVDVSRIKDGTLIRGASISPWEKNMNFLPQSNVPIPKVTFSTDFMRIAWDGNISRASDNGYLRKNRSTELALESVGPRQGFMVALFGFDAFLRDENIPKISETTDLYTDFYRFTYGFRGWGGVRLFEDFTRNYLLIRYGRGVVTTEADHKYFGKGNGLVSPKNTIYSSSYERPFVAIEGRFTNYRSLAYSFKIENDWYLKRIFYEDQLKFGRNKFTHLTLKHTLEIAPIPSLSGVRAFIELNQDWSKNEHLLFTNDPLVLMVYLRIAFTI